MELEQSARPASRSALRVLLVEDSTPDATLIRETLTLAACNRIRMHRVASLGEALMAFEQESYDAVLLDLALPDSMGLEGLVRLLQSHADLPVVVMTGWDEDCMADDAIRQGAQDYLVKGRWDAYHLERAIFHAIERKRQEDRIRRFAYRDQLTDLANRVLFLEHLRLRIARQARHPDSLFAVVMLDVDRFKLINDSMGHQAGDLVLVSLAQRLRRCVRSADTIARLGGDEFVLLLDEIEDPRGVLQLADRIHKAMHSPFEFNGQELYSSASIGVAVAHSPDTEPEDLLRQADTAMYRAKARGRGCTEQFDRRMQEDAVRRQALESRLIRAARAGEFFVVYQPIVDIAANRVAGFEALVRWQYAPGEVVMPGDFVGVAEEIGVIHSIRNQVLREAARFLRSLPGYEQLSMFVNLSNACLQSKDLTTSLQSALAEAGLPAGCLSLEITEGVLLDGVHALQRIREIGSMGVNWYLDDFGTGYSSLKSLQELPIRGIKIDRSFVDRAWRDGGGPGVVRSIVYLAKDLGLETVAEGIEAPLQLEALRELGCEKGQGYLFGRPMDRQAAERLVLEGLP